MKMIVALLFATLVSMATATHVAAGSNSPASYSVSSTGYCYEATSSSGSATIYFNTNGVAGTTSFTSKQNLASGGKVYYYVPQNWGSPITLSVNVVAPSSSSVDFSVYTSNTNPCDPNTCGYQYFCVPQTPCTHQCNLVPTYDCASNSPCTDANIAAGLFYFAHTDGHKYVQCAGVGQCYVQPCGKLFWSQQSQTCVTSKK